MKAQAEESQMNDGTYTLREEKEDLLAELRCVNSKMDKVKYEQVKEKDKHEMSCRRDETKIWRLENDVKEKEERNNVLMKRL